MSFTGLSITGSALAAYQTAENVVSDDIANVNTPGASRQQAVITQAAPITAVPGYPFTSHPGTTGDGVVVSQIQRIHDNALDTLVRSATSSQNYYTQQSSGMSNVQTAINEPGGGLSSAYSSLQSAVTTLAAETEGSTSDSSNRQAVYSGAQAVVSSLNATGNAILKEQQAVLSSASSMVSTVNGILDQIATLNGEIRESSSVGNNANTYKDQRDLLIDQLSTYVPTQTSVLDSGSTLVTVNGLALVNDKVAYHLDTPVVGTAANGEPELKVGFVSDPTPSNPTAIPLGNGQLGGIVDFYNNDLSSFRSQLDGVAQAISTEFNRVNEAGFDGTGHQGSAIFVSPIAGQQPTAATISLGINSWNEIATASASTAAGSNVKSVNSSNTPVTTNSLFNLTDAARTGNPLFANPPTTGGINGTLTVNVDGTTQTYTYNTATTDQSIGAFVGNFNKAQLGVSASYDATGQNIIFTRDVGNESLALRGKTGYAPTAAFSITDSNAPTTTNPVQAASGTVVPDLLDVIGAGAINGQSQGAVNDPATKQQNAFGPQDNANSLNLQSLFTSKAGVPPVTTSLTAASAVGVQSVSSAGGLGNIAVGQTLTIDAGTAQQEDVLVTAINSSTVPPTFTADFKFAHAAGATVQAAQQQTIAQSYANVVSQVGFAAQTAASGQTTQTNLANSLDQTRQSTNGINIDEETQKLVQYQMAYQAAARTFGTIESMITTVLTSMGVG